MTSAAPPQQLRSAATRERLLEAAVECLLDVGYARTTSTLVGTRAGLARGTQLHHFPTTQALLVSAVEHLAARRIAEVAELPRTAGDRVDTTVDLLVSVFTGRLFLAALELWVAARTDEALRTALLPLEAQIGRETHRMTVELLGVDDGDPVVRESVQLTLDLMRGLGLAEVLSDDRARREPLLAAWKDVLRGRLDRG
jgi:AcrR family transcriptional regulator